MESIKLRDFTMLSCMSMIEFSERRRWINVIDDDGVEVKTDTLLLSMNWFGLILNRYFPKAKCSADQVITLDGRDGYSKFIDDKLLNKPANMFMRREMVNNGNPSFYDEIKQGLFVYQNLLHNYLSIIGERGVVSARSIDVAEIYDHPKIKSIREKRWNNTIREQDAQKRFNKVLLEETDFDHSIFALLYRTKSVDITQSYQLLIERGNVFDLNNAILPFIIKDNYAKGITRLADSLGDSKGAGFSLISNGMALQNAEWLHMKFHNLAHVVKEVKFQYDCGSTKGAYVFIENANFRESLMGKYYFKEDGNIELIHYGTVNQLEIGKIYKIRSSAYCNHGSSGSVCSICFGKMESALPYNKYTKRSAVPGLFFGSTLGERTGQTILKTKHRIGSAMAALFKPSEKDLKYIRTSTNGDVIYLQNEFLKEENCPAIILDKETCEDFADYNSSDNVDEIETSHLRTYSTIKLFTTIPNPMFPDKPGIETPIVTTNIGSRKARMTKDFISFLTEQEAVAEGKSKIVSLANWDPSIPAFELPFVNEDMNAYRVRVEDSLCFKDMKGLIDQEVTEESYGERLNTFWRVVHEQNKDANIVIHDIFLFACSAVNPKTLDYSLPSAQDSRYFVKFTECIENRGQGNALIYGYQSKVLMGSPLNFLNDTRQGGVLESFIQPIASR